MDIEINVLAILLAGVSSMILGFMWYGPMLFGKLWMKERGFTEKSLKAAKNDMGMLYGLSFVLSLATAFVLSHVMSLSMDFYGYSAMGTGASTAFWMWLGFILPVQTTATIFSEKQNWRLLQIDTGYQLFSVLLMGVVLGLVG